MATSAPRPAAADGLFHNDTRFVSRFEILVNGMQPLLLGSNLRDDNAILNIDLTNPDIYFDKRLVLEKDTLHIDRAVFLWRNTAFQRLALRNYGDRAPSISCCRSPSTAISPISSRCAACAARGAAWHGARSWTPTKCCCAIPVSTASCARPGSASIPSRPS